MGLATWITVSTPWGCERTLMVPSEGEKEEIAAGVGIPVKGDSGNKAGCIVAEAIHLTLCLH